MGTLTGGSGRPGRDIKVWSMDGLARVNPSGRAGRGGSGGAVKMWSMVKLARVNPNGRGGS
eukprot:6087512-Pyramimonas_sp.AAC.1